MPYACASEALKTCKKNSLPSSILLSAVRHMHRSASERAILEKEGHEHGSSDDNLPGSSDLHHEDGPLTGRILTALVALFLLFDGITKIIKERHVIAASAEFGFSADQIVMIGAILTACTILYAIPRTRILGAALLTGYLGGAVVSQIRVGHGLFECVSGNLRRARLGGSLCARAAPTRTGSVEELG